MKYVIGIDLGTTNSALAFTEIKPGADAFDGPQQHGFRRGVGGQHDRDLPGVVRGLLLHTDLRRGP